MKERTGTREGGLEGGRGAAAAAARARDRRVHEVSRPAPAAACAKIRRVTTGLPELRSERLAIRALVTADAAACRAVLEAPDDERFRRWLAWAVAAPPALADALQPPYGERAVTLAATGELVGLVGLVPALGPFAQLEGAPPGGPWTPELGLYWALAPAHRGRGYATEAAARLAAAAFETLHAARLIATTERANTASQAVMRRLGMRLAENPHPGPAWLQVVGVLERPRP
jgi:RimJ/RimL family protein N-acetyltransferase